MSEVCKFSAYGENAATFLIFQALAMKPGALSEVFLKRLKRFSTGRSIVWQDIRDSEVWLFPNFGKRHGFGEPDVLILAGKYRFWIEVETTINCKRGLSALRSSLLQLWRFRCFQQALCDGVKVRRGGGKRIVGKTLNGKGEPRAAELRVAGHGVLQKTRKALADRSAEHHFVLFTVDKPKGEGTEKRAYEVALAEELDRLSKEYPASLPGLDPTHCWYAYWNGDLEPQFNRIGDPKLELDNCYVGIRRS